MTSTRRQAGDSTSRERRVTLRRLAALYGVQASYTDGRGQRRRASRDSILAALQALGAPLAGAGDLDDAFGARLRAHWTRPVEPTLVAWHGRRNHFLLRLPAAADRVRAACHLRLEDGGSRSWLVPGGDLPVTDAADLDGTRYVARTAPLPERLPQGYHELSVELGGRRCTSLLIAAPAEAFDDGTVGWGGFLPLHALHSERSWGTGDFSDADALSGWLAERGGRAFSALPLLAAFLGDRPFEPSPYLPVSRLFWNELYVDPRRLAEFEHCTTARRLVESAAFRERVAALRAAALVDYRGAMALKRRVLELLQRELRRRRGGRYDSCVLSSQLPSPTGRRFLEPAPQLPLCPQPVVVGISRSLPLDGQEVRPFRNLCLRRRERCSRLVPGSCRGPHGLGPCDRLGRAIRGRRAGATCRPPRLCLAFLAFFHHPPCVQRAPDSRSQATGAACPSGVRPVAIPLNRGDPRRSLVTIC